MKRISTASTCIRGLWACAVMFTVACGDEGTNGNPDAGTNPQTCDQIPEAAVTCTDPACSTAGTKTFGIAELKSSDATDWLVVSWAASEVAAASENTELSYEKTVQGGLTARTGAATARKRVLDPALEALAYDQRRIARLEAEKRIRALEKRGPVGPGPLFGGAIRGRTDELLPQGVKRQAMACSDANPACGDTALCVIPEGTTAGTCETALTIKFFGLGPAAEDVTASVRKVGAQVAVVVDDADAAALSAADVDELVKRFDEHIAPRSHQLFGEPKNNGKDRDGNGVVILFLTSRVAQVSSELVGFFFGDDMRPTAEVAHSNAADILYMQPPGGNVTLDALSGTIGHEYQHLINYSSKVLRNQSEREEVWLDEGLSSFAEDVLGYGRDAFVNVAAYLGSPGDVSLTGFGLIHSNPSDADSLERRGFAHLMVRYVFEQKGGADYPSGPGAVTDQGGVAAVRRMVDGAETDIDALTAGGSGRGFEQWLSDLLTTVAIDGTSNSALSCFPKYNLEAPEQDGYTMFQRGLNLRATISVPGGQNIPLSGPAVLPFETEQVPVPLNGGEFRSVNVPSGATRISVGGPDDVKIGMRAFPKP